MNFEVGSAILLDSYLAGFVFKKINDAFCIVKIGDYIMTVDKQRLQYLPVNFIAPRPVVNFKEDVLVNKLSELTDEQRMSIFSCFCRHCGSKTLPCYCWNDD